jgi:hypothetical protein
VPFDENAGFSDPTLLHLLTQGFEGETRHFVSNDKKAFLKSQ